MWYYYTGLHAFDMVMTDSATNNQSYLMYREVITKWKYTEWILQKQMTIFDSIYSIKNNHLILIS